MGEGGGDEAISIISIWGVYTTVISSCLDAASAEGRLVEMDSCTDTAVMTAGTAMVAVMITLAAATLIVMSDLSTPAAVAIFCCKFDVSE